MTTLFSKEKDIDDNRELIWLKRRELDGKKEEKKN
jgi:hypothetical protein